MPVIHNTCLVRTASCYVAVLDKASPAWIPGLLTADLKRGKQEARADGLPNGFGLFGLNSLLLKRSARGELLSWILLFDGVYKARLSLLSDAPATTRQQVNLGVEEQVADLHFPSGQVVIACLSRTGDPAVEPVLQLQPGRYRVRFQRHSCEDDHGFLERESDYPPDHGPDWTVTLSPLPDERREAGAVPDLENGKRRTGQSS